MSAPPPQLRRLFPAGLSRSLAPGGRGGSLRWGLRPGWQRVGRGSRGSCPSQVVFQVDAEALVLVLQSRSSRRGPPVAGAPARRPVPPGAARLPRLRRGRNGAGRPGAGHRGRPALTRRAQPATRTAPSRGSTVPDRKRRPRIPLARVLVDAHGGGEAGHRRWLGVPADSSGGRSTTKASCSRSGRWPPSSSSPNT